MTQPFEFDPYKIITDYENSLQRTKLEKGLETLFDPLSEVLPRKENTRTWNLGWCAIEYSNLAFTGEKVTRISPEGKIIIVHTLLNYPSPYVSINNCEHLFPVRKSTVEEQLKRVQDALIPPKVR